MKTSQLLFDLPLLPTSGLQELEDLRIGRYCYLFQNAGKQPLDFDDWQKLAGRVREFSGATLECALQSYSDLIDDGLRFVEVGDTLKQRLQIEALELWMRLTECGIKRQDGAVVTEFRGAEFPKCQLTGELNYMQGLALVAYRRMTDEHSEPFQPKDRRER